MTTRTTLTKSLHTVTVVRNVAHQCINENEARASMPAEDLTDFALTVLGFDHTTFERSDPTVHKCWEAVLRLQHMRLYGPGYKGAIGRTDAAVRP